MSYADAVKVTSILGDDGRRRSVVEKVCGACGARGHVASRGANGRGMPPETINRMFRSKGWEIGIAAMSERCPDCVRKEKAHVMTKPQPDAPAKEKQAAISEAPRSITPEDRRLIFVKLGDVYDDGAGGYLGGWTDKRVAQDLGCPMAWVSEVREQMFGPLKVNPEIAALLAEAKAILDRAEKSATASREELVRFEREVEVRVAALMRDTEGTAARIGSDLDAARAKLRAIEKAVLP